MNRFLKTKKGIVTLLATLVVVAASAIGAYAYFTANGAGAGSATVGSASAIQLSSPVVGDLYPGATATPVTVSINNPGSGNQFVGTISGSVTTQGGCLGSWFTVAPVAFNTNVLHGTTVTAPTTVSLDESNSNQNACQGLTMAIAWSSN
jgi:hypothetical protein